MKEKLNADLITGATRYEFEDGNAPSGEARYWLQEIEADGSSNWYGPAVLEKNSPAVNTPSLIASPNPFSTRTIVEYAVPSPGFVEISVYDAQGRCIRILEGRVRTAGKHVTGWDGRNGMGNPASSGVYFLKLRFGKNVLTRKVTMIR